MPGSITIRYVYVRTLFCTQYYTSSTTYKSFDLTLHLGNVLMYCPIRPSNLSWCQPDQAIIPAVRWNHICCLDLLSLRVSMPAPRLLGLIGGLAPPSTVDYYNAINAEVRRRLGGCHSAQLVLWSVDLQEVVSCEEK